MTNNGNITCRYCKKVIWFFQDHTCKPKEILEKKELGMGKKKQKNKQREDTN